MKLLEARIEKAREEATKVYSEKGFCAEYEDAFDRVRKLTRQTVDENADLSKCCTRDGQWWF